MCIPELWVSLDSGAPAEDAGEKRAEVAWSLEPRGQTPPEATIGPESRRGPPLFGRAHTTSTLGNGHLTRPLGKQMSC